MTDANSTIRDEIELFLGEATEVEARVYLRRVGSVEGTQGSASLTAIIVGPYSQFARTLVAEFPFHDLGPGPSQLAEAIVTEPCFWSPEAPYLYQVQLEWSEGAETLERDLVSVGLRRFGARGSNLILDSERVVLRGASGKALPQTDLYEWHRFGLTMLIDLGASTTDEADPSSSPQLALRSLLFEDASRKGVMLLVDLSARSFESGELRRSLRELARWPAVGAVVVSKEMLDEIGKLQKELRSSLLLGQMFRQGEPVSPSPDADLVVCELANVEDAQARLGDCGLPVIGLRPGGPYGSTEEVRAACDRLQRDLAPNVQLAGYIV